MSQRLSEGSNSALRFNDSRTSDFIVVAEGKEFFVHRSVIRLHSPYLREFLDGDPHCTRINANNARYDAMKIVLASMYDDATPADFGFWSRDFGVILSTWEIAMHFALVDIAQAALPILLGLLDRSNVLRAIKGALKHPQSPPSKQILQKCMTFLPPLLDTAEAVAAWDALQQQHPFLAAVVPAVTAGVTAPPMSPKQERHLSPPRACGAARASGVCSPSAEEGGIRERFFEHLRQYNERTNETADKINEIDNEITETHAKRLSVMQLQEQHSALRAEVDQLQTRFDSLKVEYGSPKFTRKVNGNTKERRGGKERFPLSDVKKADDAIDASQRQVLCKAVATNQQIILQLQEEVESKTATYQSQLRLHKQEEAALEERLHRLQASNQVQPLIAKREKVLTECTELENELAELRKMEVLIHTELEDNAKYAVYTEQYTRAADEAAKEMQDLVAKLRANQESQPLKNLRKTLVGFATALKAERDTAQDELKRLVELKTTLLSTTQSERQKLQKLSDELRALQQ